MVVWFLFGVFTGILIVILLLMVLPFFAIWLNRLQGLLLIKLGKKLVDKAGKTATDISKIYKDVEQLKAEYNGRTTVD
jgi:hypothetical protein